MTDYFQRLLRRTTQPQTINQRGSPTLTPVVNSMSKAEAEFDPFETAEQIFAEPMTPNRATPLLDDIPGLPSRRSTQLDEVISPLNVPPPTDPDPLSPPERPPETQPPSDSMQSPERPTETVETPAARFDSISREPPSTMLPSERETPPSLHKDARPSSPDVEDASPETRSVNAEAVEQPVRPDAPSPVEADLAITSPDLDQILTDLQARNRVQADTPSPVPQNVKPEGSPIAETPPEPIPSLQPSPVRFSPTPPPPEEPRVVIGRLNVEVVSAAAQARQPAQITRATRQPRRSNRPRSSTRSKLRFGLGQL